MMPRKKAAGGAAFLLFDVLFEDGSRSSRRKVLISELGDGGGDEAARTFLEAREQKIAEMTHRQSRKVRSVRSAG
jgi:hypothetical protein